MMEKKLLFLDIDGVLLDFHSSFCRYLSERHNMRFTQNNLEFHTNSSEKNISEEDKKKRKIIKKYCASFMESEYFPYLESLVDEQSYQQLSQKFNIFLVTNISNQQKQARVSNLALRNIDYTELFFAGEEKFGDPNYLSKPQVIQQKMTPQSEIFFLDDLSLNCHLVKKEIPQAKVFLLDKPYNQDDLPAGCIRVKNWQEFVNKIL